MQHCFVPVAKLSVGNAGALRRRCPRLCSSRPPPPQQVKTKLVFAEWSFQSPPRNIPGPQLCSCSCRRNDTPDTLSFGPRLECQMAWCMLEPLLYRWDPFSVTVVTRHSLLPISEANAFVSWFSCWDYTQHFFSPPALLGHPSDERTPDFLLT